MSARIFHADLHGLRSEKYAALNTASLDSVPWAELAPAAPAYLFVPQDRTLAGEYEQGWKVTDVFGTGRPRADAGTAYGLGICTHNDLLHVGWTRQDLKERVGILAGTEIPDAVIPSVLPVVESTYWNTHRERAKVRASDWQANIVPLYYRPFDWRFIYYEPSLMEIGRGGASRVVMGHVGQCGLNLMVTRGYETRTFDHVLVCNARCVHHAAARKEGNYVFPLWGTHNATALGLDPAHESNLSPAFVAALGERVGFRPTPEDVFHYIYGVFHAPVFRERYVDFLKRDFPRVPLPPDAGAFRAAAAVGARLVALHLLEDPALNDTGVGFPVAGDHTVKKMRPADRYDAVTHRVMLNEREYFESVPPEAWAFRVGGYQPAAKWLDDRSKRTLTDDDITHYRKMIAAMRETVALLPDADAAFALVLAG